MYSIHMSEYAFFCGRGFIPIHTAMTSVVDKFHSQSGAHTGRSGLGSRRTSIMDWS